jgi:hypothetical protein
MLSVEGLISHHQPPLDEYSTRQLPSSLLCMVSLAVRKCSLAASQTQLFLTYARIGSHEAYVRNIIGPAVAPVEEGGLGYRAVVVNFRGCA